MKGLIRSKPAVITVEFLWRVFVVALIVFYAHTMVWYAESGFFPPLGLVIFMIEIASIFVLHRLLQKVLGITK